MILYILLIAGLILLQFLKQDFMRTQFQTLNSPITISFIVTRLLQQVEQDFMSQKIENQSQGLIFN